MNVVDKIKELEKNADDNQQYYLKKIYEILIDFINNKINEEINSIDVNLLLKIGLDNYSKFEFDGYEKILSIIDIIGENSDFQKIANPTEERKKICSDFYSKVIEFFEKQKESININDLQEEIEKNNEDDSYDDFSEESIEDSAYDLLLQFSRIIFISDSKIRFEGIAKIEEIFDVLEKGYDTKYEIHEYRIFQENLQEILMENICKYSEYNLIPHFCKNKGHQEDISYFELCKDYIQYLIDEKVNILSRDGRVLKNYLSIAKVNPDFDKLGIFEKINEAYDLENVDLEEESRFLDNFIENNSLCDEYNGIDDEKFDEFIEHLQLVKLKNEDFSIPQKYINYIIEQILEGKFGVIDRTQILVETVFEDLGKNDLKLQVDNPGEYLYCVRDFIQGSNTDSYANGGACKNGVIINRKTINRFSKDNLTPISIIFHENTHISQENDFNKSTISSYMRYIMEKDKILYEIFPNIYSDNYNKMFEEIEANQLSAKKMSEFFNSLNLSDKDFKEQTAKKNYRFFELKKLEFFNRKSILFKGKNVNFNDFFDYVIQEHPEFIEKYPHLKLEYNEDGKRKGLREIIEHNRDIDKVFLICLINESNIMNIDTFSDDIDYLIELSEDYKNNFLINNILNCNIGNISNIALINFDSISEEKLNLIKNSINKIKEQMRKKDVFYKGMTQKNLFLNNKSSMVYLTELEEKIDEKLGLINKEKGESEEARFLREAVNGVTEEEINDIQQEFVKVEEDTRTLRRNEASRRRRRFPRENDKTK